MWSLHLFGYVLKCRSQANTENIIMWWPTLILSLSLSLCVHDLSLSVCCFFPFSNIYIYKHTLSLYLFYRRPKRFQIKETICFVFCFFSYYIILLRNFLSTRRLQPQSIGGKKKSLFVCVRVSRSTIHPRKKKKKESAVN